MDQGPLVNEQVEAGHALLSEFDTFFPVTAAFWLKESEDGARHLYLASHDIDDSKVKAAYGEVEKIASRQPGPWLDPFRVKVVNDEHPLARAVIDLQNKYADRLPTRFELGQLAGRSVEDVYVYAVPVRQ